MKGAIGNAFILNMVITFIVIFYMLLITSMAYSKAYKVKNYLLNSIVSFDEKINYRIWNIDDRVENYFDSSVNDYLGRVGYILSSKNKTCPNKDGFDPKDNGYKLIRDTSVGSYDFCVYRKNYSLSNSNSDFFFSEKYTYKVISYMKFDFPVIGNFIKLPLSGESKMIIHYK